VADQLGLASGESIRPWRLVLSCRVEWAGLVKVVPPALDRVILGDENMTTNRFVNGFIIVAPGATRYQPTH
jgi:hypothetical protein